MTEAEGNPKSAKRDRTSRSRELVELAALFIATGVADLFVSTLAHNRVAPVVLFGLGGLLIVTAGGRWWWTHRAPAGRVVDAEQMRTGMAWRVRATVRDVPGSLAGVTAALAAHRYDIVSLQVLAVPDGAVDEFLVRTPAGTTAANIAVVVELGGGREVRVVPADVHEFVDLPTRVLTIAAGTGADPDRLLRAVLGECGIERKPGGGKKSGFDGTSMRLAETGGGQVVVTRPLLPFTPAEFARAKAALDLCHRLAGSLAPVVLASGAEAIIRPAVLADVEAIEAMHARCGAETLARRYGGGEPPPVEPLLRHKATRVLLAETPDGDVIAMATMLRSGRCAQVGLLVEDGWQGKRAGSALLERLVTLARADGSAAVIAIAHETNTPMIRAMRRVGAQVDHVAPDLAYLSLHLHDRAAIAGEGAGRN